MNHGAERASRIRRSTRAHDEVVTSGRGYPFSTSLNFPIFLNIYNHTHVISDGGLFVFILFYIFKIFLGEAILG